MTPDPKPDMEDRLRDEADLCRNEGATDIADLLDEAADEFERLSAHLAQPQWPKLDAPARVGNGTFDVGVSSRLVVETAQRAYLHKPEKDPVAATNLTLLQEAVSQSGEIETLRAQVAQYKEDAERFQAIEHDFSVMSPNIDGNHYWVWRGRGYTGPNLRAAIDKARKV